MKRSAYSRWLPRLVGLTLFAVIAFNVGTDAVIAEIVSTRWSMVFYAIFLSAGHFCFKAVRWWYILRRSGVGMKLGDTVLYYCSGSLLGALTPGRIGEFAKVFFVRKRHGDCTWGTALGTVVLDRAVDVSVLVLVAMVGGVWLLYSIFPLWVYVGAIIVVFGALSFAVLIQRFGRQFFLNRLLVMLPHRIREGGEDFIAVLRIGIGKRVWPIALFTVLAYVLFFAHFLYLGQALEMEMPSVVFIWTIAIACLGAILPISISGIGIRDYIFIEAFSLWNGTSAQAVTISLLYLSIFNVVVAAMGIWPFLMGHMSWENLKHMRGGNDSGNG